VPDGDIVAFRADHERLVAVDRHGRVAAYELDVLAGHRIAAVYDWKIRRAQATILTGIAGDSVTADAAAGLFIASSGSPLKQLAAGAVDATLSTDATLIAYTTPTMHVVIVDRAGRRYAD